MTDCIEQTNQYLALPSAMLATVKLTGASLALKGWEAMTRLLLAEAWRERARVWPVSPYQYHNQTRSSASRYAFPCAIRAFPGHAIGRLNSRGSDEAERSIEIALDPEFASISGRCDPYEFAGVKLKKSFLPQKGGP
jgi:hypothetical protein